MTEALVGLDVAIVSFRSQSMLRDCLRSLASHPTTRGQKVHVVDNDSRDGTREMVAAEFPEVTLTESSTNLGFGRATNIAIRSGSAPFVLVLNPDTRVTPGALDALLEVMESGSTIGMAGCPLIREDGTLDHASRRSFPTPISALGHFSGLGRLLPRSRLGQYRAPDVSRGPVDAINGALMLIRRSALDEVGLFDERYWMYMEDLDLCWRLQRGGWITWYEPSTPVIHIKAGTSGEHRSLRLNYAFHWGMWRFYRDHYSSTRSAAFNFLIYLAIALKFGVSALRSSFNRRLLGR